MFVTSSIKASVENMTLAYNDNEIEISNVVYVHRKKQFDSITERIKIMVESLSQRISILLFRTNPWPEPLLNYCQLDPWEETSEIYK